MTVGHSPAAGRVDLPHTDPRENCVCVCVCVRNFSRFRLCATPWTVACQAPLSLGFSMQEYWMGSRALLQGIFPTQGSNPPLLGLLHRRQIHYC